MQITMRRWAGVTLGIGLTGAFAVAALTGLPASAARDDEQQTSLVEDFSYPGAAAITDIKLIKGDGRVLYVDCAEDRTSVQVWSYTRPGPFCFAFTGDSGFVTIELNEVYGIRNYEDFTVDATVTIDETTRTVTVPEDDWKGVGTGNGENQAVLLELRA